MTRETDAPPGSPRGGQKRGFSARLKTLGVNLALLAAGCIVAALLIEMEYLVNSCAPATP